MHRRILPRCRAARTRMHSRRRQPRCQLSSPATQSAASSSTTRAWPSRRTATPSCCAASASSGCARSSRWSGTPSRGCARRRGCSADPLSTRLSGTLSSSTSAPVGVANARMIQCRDSPPAGWLACLGVHARAEPLSVKLPKLLCPCCTPLSKLLITKPGPGSSAMRRTAARRCRHCDRHPSTICVHCQVRMGRPSSRRWRSCTATALEPSWGTPPRATWRKARYHSMFVAPRS